MARKHGGLGRGLDALIPMREEVEKAMKMADSESVEILFADEDETDLPVQEKKENDSVFRRNESVFEEKKETAAVLSEKEEADSQDQKDDVSRETSEVKSESTPEKKDKTSKDADTDSLKNAVTVRISEVEPNRKQPRKNFDDEKLDELAESIKNFGLLQPILVQKRESLFQMHFTVYFLVLHGLPPFLFLLTSMSFPLSHCSTTSQSWVGVGLGLDLNTFILYLLSVL